MLLAWAAATRNPASGTSDSEARIVFVKVQSIPNTASGVKFRFQRSSMVKWNEEIPTASPNPPEWEQTPVVRPMGRKIE